MRSSSYFACFVRLLHTSEMSTMALSARRILFSIMFHSFITELYDKEHSWFYTLLANALVVMRFESVSNINIIYIVLRLTVSF